jgi:hypothetical protein
MWSEKRCFVALLGKKWRIESEKRCFALRFSQLAFVAGGVVEEKKRSWLLTLV